MSNQNNKRRPFKWYTDGDKVIKVFEGDSIPVSFYPGRKKKQSSESLQQTTISEQQSQSNINNQEINLQAFPELSHLSESEKKLFLDIIKEYQSNGQSKTFDDLRYQDYAEIPVDIDTFVDDDRYLGYAWKDSEGKSKLYPYWRKRLRELFPDNITTSVNNAIFSGARGLGKSEIAILTAAYLMYRVLCLKNPIEYFHLKPTEKLCFAFMNIKLSLAEEIGNSKFQNTVKMSPWFMSHGTLVGRTNKLWTPPDCIQIIIGSQASDVIGLPIYFCFCLDGDTIIETNEGDYRIKDLVGKNLKVLTKTENGFEFKNYKEIAPTITTNEEYDITLEDGTVIKCTPNHRFMLTDGSYKMACELTEDDNILDFKPFGYIYKITNKLDGKIYIGKREKPYFDVDYWGSGKYLNSAYKKYGKENFTREIICWCPDRKTLWEKEIYYISELKAQDKNIGYNIANGGGGGCPHTLEWRQKHSGAGNGRFGKEVSKETRQKISEKNKGRCLGVKNPAKGRPGQLKPEGFGAKISLAHKGKKVSDETRQKIRAIQRGSFWVNNGLINSKLVAGSEIPPGWVKGQLITQHHHDSTSQKLKGHKPSRGMLGKTHTEETRKLQSEIKRQKSMWYRKKIECVETGVIYEDVYDIEKQTGIKASGVRGCCLGHYKSSHGYHWRFVDEN